MTTQKEKKAPQKTSAFMRPLPISKELAAIVGHGPLPRTEVTKRLWDYIKKHHLQDPNNKRYIRPDDKLAVLFKSSEPISMFEMTKKIAGHIKEPEKQLA